ncbi:unnamed protein product, partial [Brenthis ino]
MMFSLPILIVVANLTETSAGVLSQLQNLHCATGHNMNFLFISLPNSDETIIRPDEALCDLRGTGIKHRQIPDSGLFLGLP